MSGNKDKSKKKLVEFSSIASHRRFKNLHEATLKDTLKNFYSCTVGIVYNPIKFFSEHFDIHIERNIRRPIYHDSVGNKYILAVGIKSEDDEIAYLGIILENINLPLSNTQLLSHVAARLLSRCDKAIKDNFHVDLQYFGKYLILDAIVDHLDKGVPEKSLKLLCEGFLDLRNITFENNNFSTGLLVTRSDYAYEAGEREGTLLEFQDHIQVTPSLFRDNRFWFLADGQSTFFLCNKNLQIFNLFLMDSGKNKSLSSFSLSNTLKGKDFALITTPKEFIITTSLGEEYSFINSSWRYRDFKVISESLKNLIPNFNETARNTLIELLLDLLKSRSSSMLWIPNKVENIETLTLTCTKLSRELPLGDPTSRGLIQRLARCDGSLIVSQNGSILAYGAIANLAEVTLQQKGKRVGSGSTAALFLSNNGLSIKISQDGEASFYNSNKLLWKI